jgi:hypothetical protein
VKSEISVYRGGYEMNRMNTFGVHYVLVFLLGNFSLLMIFLFPFSKFPHTPYRCSALLPQLFSTDTLPPPAFGISSTVEQPSGRLSVRRSLLGRCRGLAATPARRKIF